MIRNFETDLTRSYGATAPQQVPIECGKVVWDPLQVFASHNRALSHCYWKEYFICQNWKPHDDFEALQVGEFSQCDTIVCRIVISKTVPYHEMFNGRSMSYNFSVEMFKVSEFGNVETVGLVEKGRRFGMDLFGNKKKLP
jgi:hypothetical protein